MSTYVRVYRIKKPLESHKLDIEIKYAFWVKKKIDYSIYRLINRYIWKFWGQPQIRMLPI